MNNLKEQVQKTLQLRPELVEKVNSEEELLQLVELLVQELIDSDFESLLRLLYRIDVSENKVKDAVAATGPEKASLSIAKLIFEREKEKAATREKYSSGETDWEF